MVTATTGAVAAAEIVKAMEAMAVGARALGLKAGAWAVVRAAAMAAEARAVEMKAGAWAVVRAAAAAAGVVEAAALVAARQR